MASNQSVPCGPCQRRKLNTNAEIWCYNCDEGLCSKCSGQHKKQTGDHKTIDIKSYKPSIRSIKTECDKHNQQLKLYCPFHLTPCCDECISSHHSKCTGIKSLANAVEQFKIEQSKESVEKDINSVLLLLNTMANEKSRNIIKGEQQCKSIKESIKNIRQEINKHLDHIEAKLYKNADTVWSEEKSKLTGMINEIEDKKKNLKKIQDDLHTVTVNSSKLQSFLGIHHIEQKVQQCQYAVDMENEKMVSEVEIKIQQNDDIKKILRELQSLKSFGEVKIVKSQIAMSSETCVRREPQVALQEQSDLKNITMNIETKKEINILKDISDMICLIDGRVIVVEQHGDVYLFTSDGKLQKQLLIPGGAFSVTQIYQDTIAISYPGEETIKIFNMEIGTVTKFITLDKSCWGLSFSNNSLAAGLSTNEIRIIDLEGNTLKSIQIQSKKYLYNLVYSNDIVIYSDFSGNAVYCVDESGKQIWQCKQDLSGPLGLCTDTYGNIIVADYHSDRILVISNDGKDSKVLLRKENGLKNIALICYKRNESYGFMCDRSGCNLAKFNLSYEYQMKVMVNETTMSSKF
ncbi:unnamed protein product [Mytilus coruscus]|uniref:B box-type domain-containing protein n=1 Tax=Mytilus coruscus TaxID=42192 RepID=A0A6J8D8C6_MYTCO|nr:unnamed protein product [Mytilus coruscus]